jgi:exodeoxyribonuclease VII large subunit
VVTIIRGGGSQTDLSWFDNYNIAYYITQFPIPVLTGIGHEKDLSVTDMVAYKSLKTPTAVADFLISFMLSADISLNEMGSRLAELSGTILEQSRNLIETARLRLIPVAGTMISDIKEKLSAAKLDIVSLGKSLIIREGVIPLRQLSSLASATKSFLMIKDTSVKRSYTSLKSLPANSLKLKHAKIENIERTLGILTPENILKRGFTITSLKGKIIKSSVLVRTGDIIDTQFAEGKIRSKVVEKK